MKKDLTEIVFILDRSGSMNGFEKDTIGGFNAFIEKQKAEPGEALLTTVLFDDEYEILHNGINLKDVQPLTEKEYNARGTTALLDAVGKTINTVDGRLVNISEEERPEKVIFVITTDGQENASREYTQAQVKELVKKKTDECKWQFVFLGADLDAFSGAQSLGVSGQYAAQFTRGAKGFLGVPGAVGPQGQQGDVGMQTAYASISNVVSSYRNSGEVDKDWNKDLYQGK